MRGPAGRSRPFRTGARKRRTFGYGCFFCAGGYADRPDTEALMNPRRRRQGHIRRRCDGRTALRHCQCCSQTLLMLHRDITNVAPRHYPCCPGTFPCYCSKRGRLFCTLRGRAPPGGEGGVLPLLFKGASFNCAFFRMDDTGHGILQSAEGLCYSTPHRLTQEAQTIRRGGRVAEGNGLLNRRVPQGAPRVRIPPSPPCFKNPRPGFRPRVFCFAARRFC